MWFINIGFYMHRYYLSQVRNVFRCVDIPRQVTSLAVIPAAKIAKKRPKHNSWSVLSISEEKNT